MKIPPGHMEISTKDFKQNVMIIFSILYTFGGYVSSYMEAEYRLTHCLGTNWTGPKIDLYSKLVLYIWTQTQNIDIKKLRDCRLGLWLHFFIIFLP
jgi:hypothetical protein